MKMKQFKYYTDNGHGWLAVKFSLIHDFNLQDKITRFSYIKGNTVYLEEDLDMSTFLAEFENRHGANYELIVKNVNGRSVIRSYQNYINQNDAKNFLDML